MLEILLLLACADPKPNLVGPVVPSSHAVKLEPAAGDVNRILDCWARAAKHRQRSKLDVDNLQLRVTQCVNGHSAIAATGLIDAIDATKVKQQFAWTFVEHVDDTECLEAVPNDPTDRLFFGAIRIWLTSGKWQVEKLQVMDRHGQPAVTWRITPHHDGVVLASLVELPVDSVPPSPVGGVDSRRKSDTIASQNRITPGTLNAVLCLAPFSDDAKVEPGEPPLSTVTPELAEILAKWEQSSIATKTSHIKFTRTTYNLVFQEEKVADAEVFFQSPDKVRLNLRPAVLNRGEQSKRVGKNGEPFRLKADRAETWIWTPQELLIGNDEEKTFEVMNVPKDPTESPFTWLAIAQAKFYTQFLLGIQADQLRKDWTLSLKKKSANSALIIATPRSPRSITSLPECWIMIDTSEWRTKAVKIFDQSGNIETVYKVNERKLNVEIPDDVFKPDLKAQGYEQVLGPKSEP